ncbi:class I SAM-dependent methyltransferase [Chloroflexota bacterium]
MADLNHIELEAESYDMVVARGVLHHLVKLDHVVKEVYQALKPGGLFWVDDTNGDETLATTLIAGGLTLFLPTELSYAEKFRAIRQFGLNTPARVKASMEAEGLSPFEGSGREHDWLTMIQAQFEVAQYINMPAFTGYVAEQLRMPTRFAFPMLRVMRALDLQLVRRGLLHNTGVVIYAHKPQP